MKAKIITLGVFFLMILIYVSICSRAGKWLVKKDEPVRADAIVILMGSVADRILQAADLYQEGLAGKVIIVEANMEAFTTIKARGVKILNRTEQARDAAIELGIPADSIIILPGAATSTQLEATIIRKYISYNTEIDTVLLVTSAPHSRRAYMIFKTAFKKAGIPIFVACIPSTYTLYNPENWWKRREDVQTVLFEYLKLANFLLFEGRKLK